MRLNRLLSVVFVLLITIPSFSQSSLALRTGIIPTAAKASLANATTAIEAAAPLTATVISDNNVTEVLLVTQAGGGYAVHATSVSKPAVYGQSSSTSGAAFYGQSTATTGVTVGVRGDTASTSGIGLYGIASATTGTTYGVRGDNASSGGIGLIGFATSATGSTIGLRGLANSASGTGLRGDATATSGATTGVYGTVSSPTGVAAVFNNLNGGKVLSIQNAYVEKFSVDGLGNAYASGTVTSKAGGFRFPDASVQTTAAFGTITSVAPGTGLTGGGTSGVVSLAVDPGTVQARITGTCASGTALAAISSTGTVTCNTVTGGGGTFTLPFSGSGADNPPTTQGVFTVTDTATGPTPPNNGPPAADTIPTAVVGIAAGSNIVAGVAGLTAQPSGVPLVAINTSTTGADVPVFFAWSQATSGNVTLIDGSASSSGAKGINLEFAVTPSSVIQARVGPNASSTQVFSVDGSGNTYVNGTIQANGNINSNGVITAMSKPFKIDDPLDPAHKWLYHTAIESPDMKNLYDGVVTLDGRGEAWVALPDWFQGLNRDFRYQLTAIGAPGPNLYIAQEISGNRFKIAGGKRGMKVSWLVTGIRQDAWAADNRTPIEQDKQGAEIGSYYHPKNVTSANSPDANAMVARPPNK